MTDSNMADLLPERPDDAHKGTFGRGLIAAGSIGMAGAAYLCGLAAYRTGAGLVEIASHEGNRQILQTLLPEAILCLLPDGALDREFHTRLNRASAVAVGCGLGTSRESCDLVDHILTYADVPVVADADALNLIARHPERLLDRRTKDLILTPHAGEMSRLSGIDIPSILASPKDIACAFASRYACTVVLKGHRSVIACGSDGEVLCYTNQTGDSSLSKGGSGDVLTGIILGLLCQGTKACDAARLGVHIHGLAGEIAGAKHGVRSVLAREITDHIGDAILQIQEER